MTSPSEKSLLDARQKTILRLAAAAGAAAFLAGCYFAPERAWANLLLGNFFFVSLSLCAAVFIAVQDLSSAGWSVLFRRVPEAMTAYLPAGAALTALLLLGARYVYPWAAPGGAEILGAKSAYLCVGGVAARAAACWAAWLVLIGRIVSLSRRQDDGDGGQRTRGAKALAAGFLVCFGLTFTVIAIDWLMSLEPKWYSTIYPWYVFAGAFEAALAGLVVLLVLLKKSGVLPQVNESHLHDLGKLLFGFSAFWAYLWFAQYLLIWYSNIPEETTFYVRRLAAGGWAGLFWLNPLVNFVAPFALLLPASRKKRKNVLLGAGALLLAGHWLDLYQLVMPPVLGPSPRLGVLEGLIFAGLAAIYALLFDRSFSSVAPVPRRDPYLQESLHFEGV